MGSRSPCVSSLDLSSSPGGPAADWPEWAVVSPGVSPRKSCCLSWESSPSQTDRAECLCSSPSLTRTACSTFSFVDTCSECEGHSPSGTPSKTKFDQIARCDLDVTVSVKNSFLVFKSEDENSA